MDVLEFWIGESFKDEKGLRREKMERGNLWGGKEGDIDLLLGGIMVLKGRFWRVHADDVDDRGEVGGSTLVKISEVGSGVTRDCSDIDRSSRTVRMMTYR